MNLIILIAIPLVAGLLAWPLRNRDVSRWIALIGILALLLIALSLWFNAPDDTSLLQSGQWIETFHVSWIPELGINFSLALDGLSLLMILLTSVLGTVSVLVSWKEITEKVGFFHFNLMWTLAGVIGVFLAVDLFLFYFFWEMMLIPMYFLIAIWGHERRRYASIKFFLFTQISGLFMLASIVGLALIHYSTEGILTFDYFKLLGTTIPFSTARWLFWGFMIAFAVKLPAVPVHTWLADAHTEAPTAGSIILAGLLLKTGAYGMIRFVLPLFPVSAVHFSTPLMILGVIGIIYGAILAFAQTDLKRLIAYTSVSHLGFVLLGIFSFEYIALQGSVMEMICHGFSTGGLFVLAGWIQKRLGTRDMTVMGGLWKSIPLAGGAAMFLAMATLGLPGMGNFIGEIMILVGSFQASAVLTVIAAAGLVAATIYSLRIIQRTFHGKIAEQKKIADLGFNHTVVFAFMIASLLWLGLYPQPILNTSNQVIDRTSKLFKGGTWVKGDAPDNITNSSGYKYFIDSDNARTVTYVGD